MRQSFWPGLDFSSLDSLVGLNQQAWAWIEDVNHRRHTTTQEVPYERLLKENLRSVAHQPDYDTSYVSYRQIAKDCLFSYHGNRYSVPHTYVGKTVVVKEPVAGEQIWVCYQQEQIAKHLLAIGKGEMVIDAEHYRGLPRRDRIRKTKPVPPKRELWAGPGVGRHFAVPEVQVRPLTSYEEVNYVSAV